MMDKTRIKWALRAGKTEHFAGRAIIWSLLWLAIMIYFEIKVAIFSVNYNPLMQTIITIGIWLTYYLSHRVEKWLYPHNFRK